MREEARELVMRDGARIACWIRRRENRPLGTLLFLHGGASNHTRWNELLDRGRLSQEWDALLPDLRGSGDSRVRGRFGLELWCDDLVQLVEAEARSPLVLVGHSLGAQIAIHFAARSPERVSGLALIDPIVRESLLGRRKWLARLSPLLLLAADVIGLANRLGLRRSSFAELDLRASDADVRRMLESPNGREELAREYSSLRSILSHEPTANYLRQVVATFAPLPALGTLRMPVLALLSTEISSADPVVRAEVLARLSCLESVSIDASHWPITEKPDEVRAALDGWLAAHWGAAEPF